MQPQLNEIPTNEWPEAFNHFSRAHHGQLVELMIVAPDSGHHTEARDLPLLGISSEPSEAGQRIIVMVASPGGPHVSHAIMHPAHVRLAEWNDGVSGQIEIDAEDGFSASVRVGPAEQKIPSGAILNGNYEKQ